VSAGRPPLRNVALVAAGGSIGAITRVAFATWFPVADGSFPWTTLLENVSGAFVLALVLTLLLQRVATDPSARLFLCTGALGAFTSYSTFAVELSRLLDGGWLPVAALYAATSIGAGLAAALAGMSLALRWIRRSTDSQHRRHGVRTERDLSPGGSA
jgi:fluoride exporter